MTAKQGKRLTEESCPTEVLLSTGLGTRANTGRQENSRRPDLDWDISNGAATQAGNLTIVSHEVVLDRYGIGRAW
jgi:hypothetical protein